MRSDLFKSMGLKAKTALPVAALFVLFVVTASYLTLSYLERKFKESISIHQFSLVSNLAHNIDDQLRIAQKTLITVASKVPPDVWTNADEAQRFLDNRIGIHSLFDNGIFLITKEGGLVAESPYRPGRRGKDLSRREWFQRTIATGKPYISDPCISTHNPGQPAIVLTVPVFDSRGKMKGMMTGSFDLQGMNILADLPEIRIGKGGYIYITDCNRTMIAHPDKARIMKPAAGPGVNRLYDQAVKGFEGSGETVTSYGVPMVTSFTRLHTTSWILGVNYPISEAYAPLISARRYFAVAAAMGTVGLLLLTWLVMRRLMSPLAAFTRHVEQLPEKSGDDRLVTIDSKDEIGILASAFNSMIRTLDGQREELHQQSQSLEQEIAERRQAQETLVVKQQQLEALNNALEERVVASVNEIRQKDRMLIQQSRQAAMGEMINNIAHQWRQPLNNLGLIVQGLQLNYEMGQLSKEELKGNSDKAMDTIQFMSHTIDDFRNFFRPDKKKHRFQVSQVVTRTISIIEGSLNKQRIAIDVDATDDPVIHGYPNEYSQVILNILTNARDVFMERKISDPKVEMTIRAENGKSVVTINDNAGGISGDVITRIFDPYFSTKGPDRGSGIGLFMSKEIIEKNMNGSLTVRNIEKGAEFRIEV